VNISTHPGTQAISQFDQIFGDTHIININNNTQSESSLSSPKASLFCGKWMRFCLAFSILNIIAFISTVDAVILTVVLSNISVNLYGTSQQAFWSGTALLAIATITPPIFRMCSEIFEQQSNLQIALLFFIMGSLLCALALNMLVFICARLVFYLLYDFKGWLVDSGDWGWRNECRDQDPVNGYGRFEWKGVLYWISCVDLGSWNGAWSHSRRSNCSVNHLKWFISTIFLIPDS